MPLNKPEDFGTAQSGYRVNDYCRYCYQQGAFTDPGVTMGEMIDFCAGTMARQGIMPEPNARLLLTEVLPGLKRWSAPQETPHAAAPRGFRPGDEQC
jgi:hypothetical protein